MNEGNAGIALRGARKSLGMSVAKAGGLLGISPATIKRWEKGQGFRSLRDLEQCLDQMGVPQESCWRPRDVLREANENAGRPVQRLLRSKRRRHGLTLQTLSKATGLSVASLHRYETGERCPDAKTLNRIGCTVGCSEDELRGLSQSLFGELRDDGESPISRFLIPNASPHFWVYRKLDRLAAFKSDNADDIPGLMHCLMIMGDAEGMCEIWDLLKPAAVSANLDKGRRAIVASLLALARLQKSKHVKTLVRGIGSLRSEIGALPFGPARTSAMIHTARIDALIGEVEGATAMLKSATRDAEALESESDLFVCELHRRLLEFEAAPSLLGLVGIQSMRERCTGCLQRYTCDVAVLHAFHRLGDLTAAEDQRSLCLQQELTFGCGSPLATRITRQLH